MKRKGFTLVELLIVIAILGTLTAVMTISTTSATSSAKAASIITNIEACKTAAAVYYSQHYNEDLSDISSEEFLEGGDYVPNFDDFSEGSTTIEAADGNGYDNWAVTVDFTNEADSAKIQAALAQAKGYSAVEDGITSFTVKLATGEITTEDEEEP